MPAFATDAVYPSRPVRIVVPVAPGGSADKPARTLATKLSEKWQQPVVVDNVVGASGTIGASQVAKAKPDGHVLLLGGEGVTLNTSLFRNLPYDTSCAFRGVTKAVVNPQVLVVRPDLGVRSFQDYVSLARRKPGELALGLPGNGGIAHVAHEMLSRQVGMKVNYIPYPGRCAGYGRPAWRPYRRHADHAGGGDRLCTRRQAHRLGGHDALPLQGAAAGTHAGRGRCGGFCRGELAGPACARRNAGRRGRAHQPRCDSGPA